MLRTLTATRYVTPLREGGSLPAIVEANDDGLYVLKFRGAGQGPKALIAELVAGEIARALGLLVPELVFMELDAAMGRSEPDFEIQALIKASVGLNLALDFLPGSVAYDALALPPVEPLLASCIVWFDAYVTNVDRTPRNTNMLLWHKRLWLIDHGASLYFQHTWTDYLAQSRKPFKPIKDHVLLPFASALIEADALMRSRLTPEIIRAIVSSIPATWLDTETPFTSLPAHTPASRTHDEHRAAYIAYLLSRLESAEVFVKEALDARAQFV
jgi:HipA-like kinase